MSIVASAVACSVFGCEPTALTAGMLPCTTVYVEALVPSTGLLYPLGPFDIYGHGHAES
jgi:hypothetical protein